MLCVIEILVAERNLVTVRQMKSRGEVCKIIIDNMSWLIFTWCLAYRLELPIKSALQDTSFALVDRMLVNLYLLYQKSSKKLRKGKQLHDLLNKSFERDEVIFKPIRTCETK